MHWRRKWQPTPVFLPGESQGRGSLVGCLLWGRTELDTTERLHFHFSLSCIGEGNGNPLQCSYLESPRDGVVWWAAIYGVTQSQTRLKLLSMQYCSSQHHILLPSPVTSTTGCCFCFGSISSFFLELFLHYSPVAYWAPTNLGSSSFSVIPFCFFILFIVFSRQEY